MNRLVRLITTALIAALMLAGSPGSASATETPPTPSPTETPTQEPVDCSREADLAAWANNRAAWEAARADGFEELYESYRVSLEDMSRIALNWQTRAVNKEVKIDRLRAKVRLMRERLRSR